MGSEAAAGMEKFLRDKRSVVRHGKRTVMQTAKGAAFTTQAALKQRRTEKLKAGWGSIFSIFYLYFFSVHLFTRSTYVRFGSRVAHVRRPLDWQRSIPQTRV